MNHEHKRIWPLVSLILQDEESINEFSARLAQHFPGVFRLLYALYGHLDPYDFYYHIEQIITTTAQVYADRSEELKALDRRRLVDPQWFQSEKMVGGVCYVDLFAGNLENLRAKIPYFQELGLTYLHLMPLFDVPEANNDGGYAVSDYRQVYHRLGTMHQLNKLAGELRRHGISLVLDFIFNHTSDEHEWARRALAGDETYQNYYYMFDDRTLPDQYERTLREIFPEQSPGSFTYRPEIKKWVWTTFRNFQWDLNYRNPAVFNAMLGELLFLANQGVEVLRLDAVAFTWKEMGTSCENLPQAHLLIQAFNALVRVAAPAMLFKSEAIVHPAEVAKYIRWDECPISYNPTLMALLWESLATRDVKLLRHSMSKRFDIPRDCAWVNYVRVHDDIGWTFADEDAAEIGINGFDHRQFLNAFYTGQFPGSFASGVPFNFNPVTRDMRISGTAASLAGLEKALTANDPVQIDLALKRLLLIHSVILSAGGIPLIYLGDEIATLNDYTYQQDPAKQDDSRWVHRPFFDWERAERRHDASTPEGFLFQNLVRLIEIRKATPELAGGKTLFFDPGSPNVLGYVRSRKVVVLVNFCEWERKIAADVIRVYAAGAFHHTLVDLVTGERLSGDVPLAPYQFRWLRA